MEITSDNQEFDGFKCIHKEFSNHPRPSQQNPCGEKLLKKILTVKEHVWQLQMQYPLPMFQLLASYSTVSSLAINDNFEAAELG
ncbi:21043_t:CDS:2 [Dentiscutata erythropus]|uniref:21043_t:CDS:1 n=1 Tax=Dentiscutata erythropus TaxID=1348616 RepID=A0A9N9CTI5_9GLOM|nr:21043_t:CDS:2 [Dentiscutata erythropus]